MAECKLESRELELIKSTIRSVPDFPTPGIIFKDITPLLSNPKAFKATIDLIVDKFKNANIAYVASMESRGFIFGAPVADRLGAGLTLIRKPGKLPAKTVEVSYELEYGSDALQIHVDAFSSHDPNKLSNNGKPKVLLVDDLLATGGTSGAAIKLISKVGGDPVAAAYVIELDFLKGREKLPKKDFEIFSLIYF